MSIGLRLKEEDSPQRHKEHKEETKPKSSNKNRMAASGFVYSLCSLCLCGESLLGHVHDDEPLRLFADRQSIHDFLSLGIDDRHRVATAGGDVADFAVRCEGEPIDAAADRNSRNLLRLLAGDVIDVNVEMFDIAFPQLFLVRPDAQAV